MWGWGPKLRQAGTLVGLLYEEALDAGVETCCSDGGVDVGCESDGDVESQCLDSPLCRGVCVVGAAEAEVGVLGLPR